MNAPNATMQRTAGRSAFPLLMTSTSHPQRRALSPAVADLRSRWAPDNRSDILTMRTFVQKPKATQQSRSGKSMISSRGQIEQSREVDSMLHLQRPIGNQAVQRMVQTNAEELEEGLASTILPQFAHNFSQIPVHPKSPAYVQAKLRVSPPRNSHEQEADRVSDQVMRMPQPQLQRACPCGGVCPECQADQPGRENEREHKSLQMQRVGAGDLGQTPVPPIVEDVLRSPGQPLDPEVSAFMEPRFGHDFSSVRVHSGVTAEQSARELEASAYTVGPDIVFARGQYAPRSAEGRKLIAHELTHVVQQTNVVSPTGSGPLSMDALAEPTAEQVSDTIMSDQAAGHVQQGDGPSIQRRMLVTAKPPYYESVLARRPAPGHADSVEFRVGTEISAKLAKAAKKIAPGGVTKDELKGLRSVALSDETINHEERGFLAGLLDSANASKVAGGGKSFVFTKASIDAHLADVADLERPVLDEAVITAFAEKWKSVAAGEPDEVEKHLREEEDAALAQMTRLVGKSREPKLRSVVAYAAAHGGKTPQLLNAMLTGASDSTAGDMLMAATVFAVADAVNHQLRSELLDGTIKVDQVSKAQLGIAAAMYSAEGIGKEKGDTIYVPESLSIDNAAHRSQIIHELEHAVQERAASGGLIRVEVELDAYRAQARYLLDQIGPLGGADREAAIKQTAKITNAILVRALILESRRDRSTLEMVIVDINSEMPAKVRLSTSDLVAFIAMDDADLMIEAKDAILSAYKIKTGDIGPGAGFRGEHDTSQM